MAKICKTCRVEDPPRGFYSQYAKECRQCRDDRRKAQWRQRYQTDPEFRHRANSRSSARFRGYSMNVHQLFEALSASQGGLCAICQRQRPLVIDHDHSCVNHGPDAYCPGCIRGLLCSQCNSGIGLLQDRLDLVQAAARYLGG